MKLTVTDIVKEYPTRDSASATDRPLRVLDSVSLELEQGKNLAIIGPSGSGKSTLLAIIGSLESATSGTVTLGDQMPASLAGRELAEFRRRQVGFVFQDHHLLPQCNVLENVLIPTLGQPGRIPTSEAKQLEERARELLQRVGLSERLDHRPAELSGGERQRVAICRALIFGPKLLLADEPTGNLDRTTSGEVAKLLLQLQRENAMMLIIVTHSDQLASQLDQRLLLDAGRLEPVA